MKSLITLTITLIASLNFALAQGLFASSYVEKTNISPKMGTQIGYQFDWGVEVGVFFQDEADFLNHGEIKRPRFYEKSFTGVFFAYPILETKNLDLKLNVRTGAVNKINFAITPSLIGTYSLHKNLKVFSGIGVRTFRPTLQAGIKFS
ncbi:MAG: hypothetical protein RJQ09_11940, partial [Cyclobacteriaceae bacterium]